MLPPHVESSPVYGTVANVGHKLEEKSRVPFPC